MDDAGYRSRSLQKVFTRHPGQSRAPRNEAEAQVQLETKNAQLLLQEHHLFAALNTADTLNGASTQHVRHKDRRGHAVQRNNGTKRTKSSQRDAPNDADSSLLRKVERYEGKEKDVFAEMADDPDTERPGRLMMHEYHDKYHKLSMIYGTPSGLPFHTGFRVRNAMEVQENIDFNKLQEIADVNQCVLRGYLSHKMGLLVLQTIEHAPVTSNLGPRIFAFGTASIAIGLVAFNAQAADMVPMFLLGCLLGWMQLIMTSVSHSVASLFPFLASFTLTFAARCIGSVRIHGVRTFCWTAIVQGPLANVLPSYTILVAAIELHSLNSRVGTLRLVAATAYSMLLALGIYCAIIISGKHRACVCRKRAKTPTLGWLLSDPDLIENCPDRWFAITVDSLTVSSIMNPVCIAVFIGSQAIMLQARWRQIPTMMIIATFSFLVSSGLGDSLPLHDTFASMVSCFFAGLLTSTYVSYSQGLVAIMLTPALFISVPGGLITKIAISLALD